MAEAWHLGRRISKFRQRAGLSQSQLAEKSGVPIFTIHSIEHGKQKMLGGDKLFAIAEALNVSVADLLLGQKKEARA